MDQAITSPVERTSRHEDIRAQQNTFAKWINFMLKDEHAVSDLFHDLRSGLVLLRLAERLTDQPMPRAEQGGLRIHQILNIKRALDNIATSLGIDLNEMNIGPEDIVDGNQKITLGLVWLLILRFHIHPRRPSQVSIAAGSGQNASIRDAKNLMTEWILERTQKLGLSSNNLADLSSRYWENGLGFAAILYCYNPRIIPEFDEMVSRTMESDDTALWMQNLTRVFDLAFAYLHVPRLIEPADLVRADRIDEKVLMTYLCNLRDGIAREQDENKRKRDAAQQEYDSIRDSYTHLHELMDDTTKALESLCEQARKLDAKSKSIEDVIAEVDDIKQAFDHVQPGITEHANDIEGMRQRMAEYSKSHDPLVAAELVSSVKEMREKFELQYQRLIRKEDSTKVLLAHTQEWVQFMEEHYDVRLMTDEYTLKSDELVESYQNLMLYALEQSMDIPLEEDLELVEQFEYDAQIHNQKLRNLRSQVYGLDARLQNVKSTHRWEEESGRVEKLHSRMVKLLVDVSALFQRMKSIETTKRSYDSLSEWLQAARQVRKWIHSVQDSLKNRDLPVDELEAIGRRVREFEPGILQLENKFHSLKGYLGDEQMLNLLDRTWDIIFNDWKMLKDLSASGSVSTLSNSLRSHGFDIGPVDTKDVTMLIEHISLSSAMDQLEKTLALGLELADQPISARSALDVDPIEDISVQASKAMEQISESVRRSSEAGLGDTEEFEGLNERLHALGAKLDQLNLYREFEPTPSNQSPRNDASKRIIEIAAKIEQMLELLRQNVQQLENEHNSRKSRSEDVAKRIVRIKAIQTRFGIFSESITRMLMLLNQAIQNSKQEDEHKKTYRRLESEWKQIQDRYAQLSVRFKTQVTPRSMKSSTPASSPKILQSPRLQQPRESVSSLESIEYKLDDEMLPASEPEKKSMFVPSKPVNAYKPDPNDPLDVTVARIVNSMPIIIVVQKQVPGRVRSHSQSNSPIQPITVTFTPDGRSYVFSNSEKEEKVGYCRLRGTQVVVRVGGGWQDLSSFLLDRWMRLEVPVGHIKFV